MTATSKVCRFFSSIILIALPLLFSQCRYKENDTIALQTTYKRLCKTWILESAISEGTGLEKLDSIATLRNRKLIIDRGNSDGEIMLNSDPEPFVKCMLDQNKTRIYLYNRVSEGSLKILKLTKDDLWLRGNPIAAVLGGGGEPDEIFTLKYRAASN